MELTGVAVLSGWSVTRARGRDARAWLHDLLTADVERLEPGGSAIALLLTPTGRIRAAVTMVAGPSGLFLVQAPDQPRRIRDLLEPYILSSDVELEDSRLVPLAAFDATLRGGHERHEPSVLGAGSGAFVDPDEAATLAGETDPAGPTPVDLEVWRVARGVARFPVDLDEASLPNEADFGEAIDLEKGCYLGQEAVAKVRNLGHPPRLVLAGMVGGDAQPGTELLGPAGAAGQITSVGRDGAVLARVRWKDRASPLRTPAGATLQARGVARGGA